MGIDAETNKRAWYVGPPGHATRRRLSDANAAGLDCQESLASTSANRLASSTVFRWRSSVFDLCDAISALPLQDGRPRDVFAGLNLVLTLCCAFRSSVCCLGLSSGAVSVIPNSLRDWLVQLCPSLCYSAWTVKICCFGYVSASLPLFFILTRS